MYDLLIQGGQVLDPGRGLKGRYDVAVEKGRIVAVRESIPPQEARQAISAQGKLVAPGLIDVHVHVYPYAVGMGVEPDLIGVRAGVTTVLDAGSGGSGTFEGFARFVVPQAKTRILSLVNVSRGGFAMFPQPEVRVREDIDVPATVATIQNHPDLARGVKVRAVGPAVTAMGVGLVRLAKEISRETATQLMVHIGDPQYGVEPPITPGLLPLLEPGDIVTHLFTSAVGGVLDANGRALPQVKDAARRGVHLDVGMGRMHVSFDVAQRLLDQEVAPFTVSTDITLPGRRTPIYSLTEVMSWSMALGFTLEDVVRMTTANAAQVLRRPGELGTLAEGAVADITLLDLVDGPWTFTDTGGQTMKGEKALRPALTIKGGEVISVDWGPHPWGWLPNPRP